MTTTTNSKTTANLEALSAMRQELRDVFPEMDDAIDGILICLLTRQNIILFGPSGIAKTALTQTIANAINGSQFFDSLMSSRQPPEDIFGPMSPSRLMSHDEYVRNTKNRLSEAHIALLDEIGRSSPSLRGMLLRALNERTHECNGEFIPMPLITAVGASNQFLTDPEDGAIYDRFAYRLVLQDPERESSWDQIIEMQGKPSIQASISLDDLTALQQAADHVAMSDTAKETLKRLRHQLKSVNIRISPRRIRQAVTLLKAYACMEGDRVINSDTFVVLNHVLWDRPQDRAEVAQMITEVAKPSAAAITEILDKARTAMNDLGAAPSAAAGKATWNDKAVDTQVLLTQCLDDMQKLPVSSRVQTGLATLLEIDRELKKALKAAIGWS